MNHIRALESALTEVLPDTELSILDAGCGHESYLNFGARAKLTGIDISAENLAKHKGLTSRIVGDLQTFPLPTQQFDIVVCWDVLEHLAKPKAALRNMLHALKPGGLLVLAFPNVFSIKGLVTKFTPLSFHRFVYRRLYHIENPEFQPYPTYLRFAMSPSALMRFANSHGLSVEYFRMLKSEMVVRVGSEHPVIGFWLRATRMLGQIFGLDTELSDCILVLRSPLSRESRFHDTIGHTGPLVVG